jgi:hypothetical protein
MIFLISLQIFLSKNEKYYGTCSFFLNYFKVDYLILKITLNSIKVMAPLIF